MRCGVEFGLKIAPKLALGPPSDPRHHLARCYRRPGSMVGADAERSQQKRQRKQGTGGEAGRRSCRPRLRSAARGWTDSGPGSWPFAYMRALRSMSERDCTRSAVSPRLGYVQAVRRARMADAGRPSTDNSLRSKGPGGAPSRHCRVMRPQGRVQQPTTAARTLHVPRGRTKK